MKRIGVIQIWQESNGFNPVLTTLEDFRRFGLVTGEKVLEQFGGSDEIGGFVSGVESWRGSGEAAGLLRAVAWPGGPLAKNVLDWFVQAVREGLQKAGCLDGLLFSLHGALVSEGERNADACLLKTARMIVGQRVPIVATVDLHAHITSRMRQASDALVAYHTNPHVDRRETGRRAAQVLGRLLDGARPAHASVKLPMISVGETQNTFAPPLAPVFERLREMEGRREVLSAGVLMTQPWLDVPQLGWSTLVTTDGDAGLAQGLADELADACWSRREQMRVEFCGAEEAVARALAVSGKPVVIADGADATNSGAGGDSTHLLRAMTSRNVPEGALSIMVDREAVACAKSAGPGGEFKFAVGGKRDHIFSRPLAVTGRVVSLQPARYVLSGHLGDALPIDMGLSAIVRIRDVTLLLVEFPGPGSSPMMYRCVGLEPKEFKIVIVKSPAGFRAEYEPFAAGIILTDCPGCASPRFAEMPYKNISRPLWPLDNIDNWRKVTWLAEAH